MIYDGGEIDESEDDDGGGIREDDVYNGKKKEPVLALLSDLYLEFEVISVDVSGISSCSILHHLLTTYTTNYYPKENVYDFGLRGPFYSKQDIIDTYRSLV